MTFDDCDKKKKYPGPDPVMPAWVPPSGHAARRRPENQRRDSQPHEAQLGRGARPGAQVHHHLQARGRRGQRGESAVYLLVPLVVILSLSPV